MKALILMLILLSSSSLVFSQTMTETEIEVYPSGLPQLQYSFYRKEDGTKVLHGKRIVWSESGRKIEEGEFINGKAEGLRTYWHENGRKSAEGNYRHDQPTGLWLKWYPNEQKQEECEYQDGQKHGVCRWWNDQGQQVDQVSYIGGKPLAIIEWEKRNAGKHQQSVFLYPHIIVGLDNLTFVSRYAGITKTFTLDELEEVFSSLPDSVWVDGKQIWSQHKEPGSIEDYRQMGVIQKEIERFFQSKGYRIGRLPN